MAYRFRPKEPFEAGLVRIGLEQIKRAGVGVEASAGGSAVELHQARKALKRLRALLRLVRPALGESDFRRENARFRDIAALLAGARDRDVLLATLDALAAEASTRDARALAPLREAIGAALAHDGVASRARDCAEATRCLEIAAGAWPALAMSARHDVASGLWRGLERSYRDGRRGARHLAHDLDDEAAHEVRKAVQQHWRHMALLRAAWPHEMSARVELARELSQLMGDEHDLALVKDFAASNARGDDRRRVVRLVEARQASLRALALPLCTRLYAEKPGSLSQRMACYWHAACRQPRRHDDGAHDTDTGRQAMPTVLAAAARTSHGRRRSALPQVPLRQPQAVTPVGSAPVDRRAGGGGTSSARRRRKDRSGDAGVPQGRAPERGGDGGGDDC